MRQCVYIAIICKPSCDVMNFEVKLIFPIKGFSLHDQKVVKVFSVKKRKYLEKEMSF